MVAKVRTNRVFDGRMYGKTRPNSCTIDVRKSLDFELYLGFNDIDCDVRQVIPGKFATDVIIQVYICVYTIYNGKNNFPPLSWINFQHSKFFSGVENLVLYYFATSF